MDSPTQFLACLVDNLHFQKVEEEMRRLTDLGISPAYREKLFSGFKAVGTWGRNDGRQWSCRVCWNSGPYGKLKGV